MKICYITEYFTPYRVEWMNLLSKNNLVEAYYLNSSEKTREPEWLRFIDKDFFSISINEASNGSDSLFIKKIKQKKYDIYLVDGYSSTINIKCLFSLLRDDCNVFVNVDGIDLWRRKTIFDTLKGILKKAIFSSGASFLCGSTLAAEHIISKGAKKENVFVHNFTSLHETDIETIEEIKKEKEIYKQKLFPGKCKIALAVGRFIPLKHYDILIDSWVDMPKDYLLCLIGSGVERSKYEAIIEKNQLTNIQLIDHMPPDELKYYFLAADLFVHPSSTETWGLVINEAMSKGLPVITTNRCVAGVELIRNGIEGYVIPVDDTKLMVKYIKLILSDEVFRRELSQNCINRIKGYTLEALADRHLSIFNDRLKGQKL